MEKKSSAVGLVIGVILLLLIFGSSILYLGVFNLSPASQSIGAAEGKGGMASAGGGGYYAQPTYHVFNYFNSGALSIMLVLGIIVTLLMVDSLYKKTDSLLASLLYILGTLLLFSSVTILLFGVHDLLNFSGQGETFKKPTVMQQYGWLIESIVFGVLGLAFIQAAEQVRRREEEKGSLIYLAVTPVAALLILFAIPIFFFGVHGVLYSGYGVPSFAWVIETIVFGGIGALAFNWIDKKREENGEEGLWKNYPLYAAGFAFLLPAAFIFMFGSLDYLHNQNARDVWKPFIEAFVFAPLGFLAFFIIDKVTEKDKRSSLPMALTPVGAIFMLAATFALLFGFSGWIRADITASNYRTVFAWVVDVILFGLIGFASLSLSDKIKNRFEKTAGDLPRVLPACGLILWVASLGFFLIGMHSMVFDSKPEGKFILEFLVYALIGVWLIAYSGKLSGKGWFSKEGDLPNVLAFSGGLLVLIALLAFVFDLHGFLYSENPESKWILRVLAYGIVGVVYLLIGNSMKPLMPKKGKEKPKMKLKQEKMVEG